MNLCSLFKTITLLKLHPNVCICDSVSPGLNSIDFAIFITFVFTRRKPNTSRKWWLIDTTHNFLSQASLIFQANNSEFSFVGYHELILILHNLIGWKDSSYILVLLFCLSLRKLNSLINPLIQAIFCNVNINCPCFTLFSVIIYRA
jgi:hypothetical protein